MRQFRILFLVIICSISLKTFAQNGKDTIRIYLSEFDIDVHCNNKYKISLKNGDSIDLDILNCKGEMKFKVFDKNGGLKSEGHYMNSLDTLKRNIGLLNEEGVVTIVVEKYFEPLPDGEWKYYNPATGKLIKTENWVRGVEITKVR
jgi:hypothetical protein